MTRLKSLFTIAISALSLASAQLIPNNLPACAASCTQLQQAATSCEQGPAASQKSCFCQSSLLASIKTGPTINICAPECAAADWSSIAQWYTSTCADGGAAVSSATPGGTTASATPATGATQTGPNIVQATGPNGGTVANPGDSSSSGGSSGGSGVSNAATNDDGNSEQGAAWWSTHYGYVIMLIVLLLFFSIAGIGGSIWYRRRQRAKGRNMDASFSAGGATQWAPNSSTHDFNAAAERQARGALAAQPGHFGGAAMVERGNSRKGRGKGLGSVLKKSNV